MLALYALLVPLPSTQQMHIPDGYLSPLTAAVMFALVLPFWWRGAASLRQKMTARNVPLIALMAAFSFVVMMFNVPLPGGTTGHAVGGVLAAIVLGPEIAVVAISIALVIQAFFFGDGGILAIGANCFNMAVVLPFVGYTVYQLIAGRSAVGASRRAWAAALGGYVGLTLSALFTAVEFGIQPALSHTAAGAPLYAPYPLAVAIPAMVLPHMLVASVVEAALTAAVVVYLQRSNPAILQMAGLVGGRAGSYGCRRRQFPPHPRSVDRAGRGHPRHTVGVAGPRHRVGRMERCRIGAAGSGLRACRAGSPEWPVGRTAARLWHAWPGRPPADLRAVRGLGCLHGRARRLAAQRGAAGAPACRRLPLRAPVVAGRGRAFERTLAGLGDTVEQTLFAERISRRPGLLQGLDGRVKLLSTLALLLAVSLSHSLAVIAALYVLTLLLAWRSAVPMGFFIKRVWLLLPFFTGVIALPALFLTPGPALWRLPWGWTITQPGLTTALFLLLRVGASVSAAVLLVLTTPWNTVLKSLGVLHVPDVFVVILGMTYRYIYLLLRLAGDLFMARQSRVLRRLSSAEERRLTAAGAGVLLSRSLQLSEDVYLAMQSRGFRGYPRTLDTFRLRPRDWAFAAAALLITGAAVWLGR